MYNAGFVCGALSHICAISLCQNSTCIKNKNKGPVIRPVGVRLMVHDRYARMAHRSNRLFPPVMRVFRTSSRAFAAFFGQLIVRKGALRNDAPVTVIVSGAFSVGCFSWASAKAPLAGELDRLLRHYCLTWRLRWPVPASRVWAILCCANRASVPTP